MSMSINALARQPDDPMLYDKGFRRHMESHMGWFRVHPTTTEISLDPHDVYKYEGDFYGLLDLQGIPRRYHWIVLRLNHLNRATDVPSDLTLLLIPDFSKVDNLMQMYKTKAKKTLT